MLDFTDRRYARIRDKMAARVAPPAIDAFLDALARLERGETGLLPESELQPIENLHSFDDTDRNEVADSALLNQLAVIKLNGGLGTGMGLSGPKSLLPIRGPNTFLDFIARQILRQRRATSGRRPVFLLMNSFHTRSESLRHLESYSDLRNEDGSLDFLQNMVPKLDPETHAPVSWSDDSDLEWCPPGHGDLYPSLLGNDRLLDRLIGGGVRYLFVSNADNLGATADSALLRYFADSGLSFLMEVAPRSEVDRKGGHLAQRRRDGRLVLRESAQCPPEDMPHFQDISRHRFFNTNNLWIQLEHLRETLAAGNGTLPLPLIRNRKTVDPQNPDSPVVLQLESAMGAAIECFDRSGALLVPRQRFSPVKSTNDLLAVRSDAYETRDDGTVLRLAESRNGRPPHIDLDPSFYKMVTHFDACFPQGPPSLIECQSLNVTGQICFSAGTAFGGDVSILNSSKQVRTLPSGTYADDTIEL